MLLSSVLSDALLHVHPFSAMLFLLFLNNKSTKSKKQGKLTDQVHFSFGRNGPGHETSAPHLPLANSSATQFSKSASPSSSSATVLILKKA